MAARLLLLVLAAPLLAGAGSGTLVTIHAPTSATAGVPVTVSVRDVRPVTAPVVVLATDGKQRVVARTTGPGRARTSRLRLPSPGRWTLTATVAGRPRASGRIVAVEPPVRHPFAVLVRNGTVYVGDGTRVLAFGSRGRTVLASGLTEVTGLASGRSGLYAADYAAGTVRRVGFDGRVSTLARLPEVTAVATDGDVVFAVTMDGNLARIPPTGAVTQLPVRLVRPHGISLDRDGSLLVAEDSRRVRRIARATGAATSVATGVDTNKIAVARDGTLYLAGSTLTGGTLRRRAADGDLTTIVSDLRVSDVGVLPDGAVVITTVEPGAVLRVDPQTGARTAYRR